MTGLATAALASDRLEKLLSKNPSAEAERSFKAGDRRYLVVPVCGDQPGEVLPGWPMSAVHDKSRGATLAFQMAMDQGQRPLTCDDFVDDKKQVKFMRAVKYAERYNETLRVLELGK